MNDVTFCSRTVIADLQRKLQMVKKVFTTAVFTLLCLCYCDNSQGQYGDLRMQVGSYGSDVYATGYGYGNGFYGNYGSVYQYRSPYSYGGYNQPNDFYLNSGYNPQLGYNSYPVMTYNYGASRSFATPLRYLPRRFR